MTTATKQDYGTPRAFIRAVERRFGPIVHDLAAHAENAKHASYYTEADDSLAQPWAEAFPAGNLWLNPPFKNIAPWAEKSRIEAAKRQGLILMLTPASVASIWYREQVERHAFVRTVMPRLTFEGESDPYPKDLMLSIFNRYGFVGLSSWNWSEDADEADLSPRSRKKRAALEAALEELAAT